MPHLLVDINNPHKYTIDIIPSDIIKIVLENVNYQKDTEVSLSFVNNEEISELYEQYFGYAHFTDVLSFPSDEINPENGHIHLGDIIIAYPFVVRQAETLANDLSSETTLLLIHGTLHLLGYDHDQLDNKKEMWAIQKKILEILQVQIVNIPE